MIVNLFFIFLFSEKMKCADEYNYNDILTRQSTEDVQNVYDITKTVEFKHLRSLLDFFILKLKKMIEGFKLEQDPTEKIERFRKSSFWTKKERFFNLRRKSLVVNKKFGNEEERSNENTRRISLYQTEMREHFDSLFFDLLSDPVRDKESMHYLLFKNLIDNFRFSIHTLIEYYHLIFLNTVVKNSTSDSSSLSFFNEALFDSMREYVNSKKHEPKSVSTAPGGCINEIFKLMCAITNDFNKKPSED